MVFDDFRSSSELSVTEVDVAERRQLLYVSRGLYTFYNMSNYCRRAFLYAGPNASMETRPAS